MILNVIKLLEGIKDNPDRQNLVQDLFSNEKDVGHAYNLRVHV